MSSVAIEPGQQAAQMFSPSLGSRLRCYHVQWPHHAQGHLQLQHSSRTRYREGHARCPSRHRSPHPGPLQIGPPAIPACCPTRTRDKLHAAGTQGIKSRASTSHPVCKVGLSMNFAHIPYYCFCATLVKVPKTCCAGRYGRKR
jgi:hypothetical protein